MAGLSNQQIEQGVTQLVAKGSSPIAGLGDAAWAYLLKFTAWHEGVVNRLYNNMGKPNVAHSDVTIGVGISLPSKESCNRYLNLFYVKDTNFTQPATLTQLQADWTVVDGMSRAFNSLDDFGRVVQTEITPQAALQGMVDFYAHNVPDRLNCPEFADFAQWPAQARVALTSYCYGLTPKTSSGYAGAPAMRAALRDRDFDTAGRQSYISVWDPTKVRDHRVLFWNAARLLEQSAKSVIINTDWLPAHFDSSIELIPLEGWVGMSNPPRPPDSAPP
jgi:hypothetical protein